MLNSKLGQLLQTFSPSDYRQLEQILDSPFFNHRADLPKLLAGLAQAISAGEEPDRHDLYALMYPQEPYDDARLRHALSFLYKQCENLLVEQALKQESHLRDTLLIRSLQARKAEKPLRNSLSGFNRKLESIPLRNTDFHLHRIDLIRAEMELSDARTEKLQTQFQALSGEMDLFFVLHKLQLASSVLTHQRLFKVSYDLGLLDAVLDHIHRENLLRFPPVAICYACYQMLAEEQPSHFFTLKSLLPQAGNLFPPSELRTFYTHLINFCIARTNRGEQEYLREVLDIYRLALGSDVLLDEGQLSPFTYKNIVSAAIKLHEFAWAADFIAEYRHQLPPESREDYHSYNLARLHLANGKYPEVVRILTRLHIDDPFTHLDARIILIKAYYELGEYQLIEYLLDNLKHILRRKEFLTYHKKNYTAFTNFTRRLLNLPASAPGSHPSRQHQKLMAEVQSVGLLSEQDWLLEKLAE